MKSGSPNLESIGHDAESLLAQELVARSSVGSSRASLLSQARVRLDEIVPLRDQIRSVLQAGQGGGTQKQQYRELCLEIATLEKALGRYAP